MDDTHSAPTHPLLMKPPVPYLSYPPGLGVNLADLTFDELAPSQKKEGGDWASVINPEIPLAWDIDGVHDLRHDGAVYCIQFSHDGKYIATGGDNGVARIFDVSSGIEVATMDDEEKDRFGRIQASFFGVSLMEMGIRIARWICHPMAASSRFLKRTKVSVWNIGQLPDVEPQYTLLATNDVYKVAISPNTEHIAARCTNGSICVWSAKTGLTKELLEFEGHDDTVLSISFAPDGQHLTSSSMDGTAKMWNIGSAAKI
ncbi:quinon protein alcohol dehydrogenase-like superfamily [Aspergillus alliaceus]|uniref:Quinon protein alcohol dehydrogenase-like superfamily n=1 Tax=Petromyces alliaceus TaxID=209559 RepID=A0A5N7BUK4_PETAA|nr:quinon protein alcohol dehydrogenase-like superfamily [Aspergillus alliaceus]